MKELRTSYLLNYLFLILNSFCFSQNPRIDSLLNILKTVKEDTTKVNTFNSLFLEYEFSDDKKVKEYLDKALELSQKINYKKGLANTYLYFGYYDEDKGNYPEALKNYTASLKIREAMQNKKGIADSYNNIGNVFYAQGNYPEALKNYFASLKIREALEDKKGVAGSYTNIGLVYFRQCDYLNSLKHYVACLKLFKAIDNKQGIAYSYNNIGLVYYMQGNLTEAIKNYIASFKIRVAMGDKKGIAESYNNIGGVYSRQANYTEALKNYFASVKIKEEIGDKKGIATSYGNIGIDYTKQKKYKEAGEYLNKSKELLKIIGAKENLKKIYEALTKLDSAKGNFKGAYENHKLYILYRDSIDNEETRKQTIQSQMTFDFEKKEAIADAEHKKELENQKLLANEKSRKQKAVLILVSCVLLLVFVFAGFIFRSLRVTRKQKNIIEEQKGIVEHQKLLVEEHQKEIVDSITYAKRIQYTLLANKKLLDDNLNGNVISSSGKGGVSEIEHSEVVLDTFAKGADTRTDSNYFVLFKPKDIVSGDFYWASKKSCQSTVNKEETIERFYIAACDSTGHGVPGAFMSLLNISFLNEAVNEKNILEPHEILNHVRKRLIENMDGGQDGMDCILLCIENSSFENEFNSPLKRGAGGIRITYAAANNSPTLIKNGKLISLEADKMPVGKGENVAPFTSRTIDLTPSPVERDGEMFLYLYTDGYADQFGGPKGKKFKYKQLDELLISISNLLPDEQSEILNNRFEEWKGNLEQVDDMLVIGLRI